MTHRAGAVSGTIQRFIMDNVEHAIGTFSHIQLNVISPLFQRQVCGKEGVLWREMVGATV